MLHPLPLAGYGVRHTWTVYPHYHERLAAEAVSGAAITKACFLFLNHVGMVSAI